MFGDGDQFSYTVRISHLLLEIVEGPDAGRQVPVSKSLELGRDPAAEIVLSDKLVSRRHARVLLAGEQVYAEDLDSRNGTFVNGSQIYAPTRLEPDDQLLIGATVLELRSSADLQVRPTAVLPVPPALAAPAGKPDYVPADISKGASGLLESLLDVETKKKARLAPLGILVLVVFALLIFFALRHQ